MFNTLVLLFAFATPALGAPPERGERPPPPHVVIVENAAELGISDQTAAAIEALAEAARPDFDALHEAARAGDEEARTALHDRQLQLRDDIDALLTEEQQSAVRELMPPPPEGFEGGPPEGRPQR